MAFHQETFAAPVPRIHRQIDMRYETSVAFTPKPKPMPLPAPVLVGSRTVGELISYDWATGTGKAMLDGDLSIQDLPLLTVGDYGYRSLNIGDKTIHRDDAV